jgi:hypothetical protein
MVACRRSVARFEKAFQSNFHGSAKKIRSKVWGKKDEERSIICFGRENEIASFPPAGTRSMLYALLNAIVPSLLVLLLPRNEFGRGNQFSIFFPREVCTPASVRR